jgi:hypothetical protein
MPDQVSEEVADKQPVAAPEHATGEALVELTPDIVDPADMPSQGTLRILRRPDQSLPGSNRRLLSELLNSTFIPGVRPSLPEPHSLDILTASSLQSTSVVALSGPQDPYSRLKIFK